MKDNSREIQRMAQYEEEYPADFYGTMKSGIERAIEANQSVAIRHMEVLSMQADETEALLQNGNLSEEQFERVLQENREIRSEMASLSRSHGELNYQIVLGACVVMLTGGLFYYLRAA